MSDEIEDVQPSSNTVAISNSELSENDSQTLRLSSAHQSSIPHFLYFLISSNQSSPVQPFKNLKASLDYLNELKEPLKIINDNQAILALVEVNDLFRKKKDQITVIMESKLQMVLKDLLAFFYEKLFNYVKQAQFNITIENTNPYFTTFHLIVELIEILIVSSKEFATTFHMISGTKIILNFFENYILMHYLTKSFTELDPYRAERKMNYCKALASLLNSLFYLKTARIQAFRELNAITILISFSNLLKFSNCELIFRSHLIIGIKKIKFLIIQIIIIFIFVFIFNLSAGLASRKQIEFLPNIEFTILILEKTIQMFAQASQKKTKYTSYQFDLFYENDMRSFEINTHDSPNTFIVHMLLVTEAFLVNDDIKYRVFNTIKNSLIVLLIQGDLIEKYFSLNLLINFGYDDVLNEKIRRSSNVITLVDQILSQSPQLDENIKNSAICLKSVLNIKATYVTYRKNLPFYFTKNIISTATATPNTNTTSNTTVNSTMAPNTLNQSLLSAQPSFREVQVLISYHESNELICELVILKIEAFSI